jgi:PQQ-dependent catabolism-associated CXXCW motif protein
MRIGSKARGGMPGWRLPIGGSAAIAPWRSMLHLLCVLLLAASGTTGVRAADTFADEDTSWGIEPPPGYRAKDYHGPTPAAIPGARVLTTLELKAMLEGEPRPFLVDVLSGPPHRTLRGALWLHNGGLGDFDAIEEKRYLDTIALLAGHDKERHLVFFCSGARCWLSYNAALRAARAGYSNVYWYRGGIEAWRAAGLPTTQSDNFPW